MKEVIEFFKDPKKKSLTQLALYFIFFVFVFIILGNSQNNIPELIEEEKTAIETYETMDGYTYKVIYTNLDKIDVIEGTYYKNKTLFNYNNLKYYYEDTLYKVDNDSYYLSNIEYDITKVFNSNLYNIIKSLEVLSTTTYKDGTIDTNYNLDSNMLYNYLYNNESNYNSLVNVTITEKDNLITKIIVDLTSLNINLTKIEIEYNNINNIENIDFNKDNYTYKENL